MSKKNHEAESEAMFLEHFERLTDWIRKQIFAASCIEDAINFAAVYGELRRKNFDGCYSDSEIESFIEALWVAKNDQVCQVSSETPHMGCGAPIMLLATELYDRGGHSQVVLTWLKEMCDSEPHVLVVTEGLSDGCRRQLSKLNLETVLLNSSGEDAITDLVKIGAKCRMLVLHIHPYDIVAAVAARRLREMGVSVIFYNHADHLFSYGIESAALVCEISDYGESINRVSNRAHGIRRRVGVPIVSPDLKKYALKKNEKGLGDLEKFPRVVSAGGAYKYSPDGNFELADFIDILIANNKSVILTLVGPTGNEAWWLSRRSQWGDRVIFRGLIPKDEYLQELAQADIYIDSFPVTGGTAFPEALVAGLLCVGLCTPIQGYSKADSLKVKSAIELAHIVVRLLQRDVREIERIESVRESVLQEQSLAAFHNVLVEIYKSKTYEDCGRPLADVPVDDVWIRGKWLKDKKIYFPQRRMLARLPWAGYVGLFLKVQGMRVFVGHEDMRQILLAFWTKININLGQPFSRP